MLESLELFIALDENGSPVGHPMLGSNFREVYPQVDTDNLPANWARFVRSPVPDLGPYEKLASIPSTYQLINGVFTDVWTVVEMTPTEKARKQKQVRDDFSEEPYAENYTTWVLDEETCLMVPPTPKPARNYGWNGATNSWEIRDLMPTDGKTYIWNPIDWNWEEVQQG